MIAQAAQVVRRSSAIPNWAVASALGTAAVSTYYYTLYVVGSTDIDAEVRKVLTSEQRASK